MRERPLKTCKTCLLEKPSELFHATKNARDGLAASCTSCANERARIWREQNRERHRSSSKEYFYKNQVAYNEKSATYYRENRETQKAKQRVRNSKNSAQQAITHRAWLAANPQWRKNYYRQVLRKRPDFRANMALRRILHRLLRLTGTIKSSRSSQILGYSAEMLRCRIEFQFSPGMSWSNHGEWHIDHRIPVSVFLARGETRPQIVNALSNLRPLWAADNMSKGARWSA